MVPWIDLKPSDLCVCVRACHTFRGRPVVHARAYARILRRGWPTREKSLNFRASGQRGKNERSRKEGGYSFLLLSFAFSYVPFLLHPPSLFPLTLCSSKIVCVHTRERKRGRYRQRHPGRLQGCIASRYHTHIYIYRYRKHWRIRRDPLRSIS